MTDNPKYSDRTEHISNLIADRKLGQAQFEIQQAKIQAQHEFIDATFAIRQLRYQERRIERMSNG